MGIYGEMLKTADDYILLHLLSLFHEIWLNGYPLKEMENWCHLQTTKER